MSFSKKANLNLDNKNSSSENDFTNLFNNTCDKKDNIKIEKDSDSDDLGKKFGKIKDNSKDSDNENSEEEEDEDENLQLNIMEDNSNDKFSIGKYLNKDLKKRQKNKITKTKKYRKDDTYSNEEKMEMDYSSSEKFIKEKQQKKKQVVTKKILILDFLMISQ